MYIFYRYCRTFYFRETIDKVKKTRTYTVKRLEELGFNILPSSTNFVFAEHKSVKAADIFDYLKKNSIYVRYFKQPRIDNFLRISIGTDEEMDKMFDILKPFLDKVSGI